MNSISEIMCLCRLCLEKEDVNTPIFEEQGEIGQISLKISTCLPVKVSKEDDLPKNICGGCLCKLEMFYQFWNTCANADKKLVKWIDQISVNKISDKRESAASNVLIQHSIDSNPIVLKQEVMEIVDTQSDDLVSEHLNMSNDDQDYLLQQQSLTYEPVEFQFQQDEFETVAEDDSSNAGVQSHSQHKRVAAMRSLSHVESEDEDDPDSMNAHITKTEDDTDDSGEGDPKPTTFVGLPPDDNVQAGTSTAVQSIRDAPFTKSISGKKIIGNKIKVRNLIRSDNANKEGIFTCDVCEKRFAKKQLLLYHQNRHIQNYKVKCDQCDKGFYTMFDFKRHYAVRHKGVRFVCNNCSKSFLDENCFRRHIKTHDDDYVKMQYTCAECSKIYYTKGGLNVHMKLHKNMWYICDICGKSVTSRTSLKHHMMVHTGEKPFVCETCGKCFNKKMLLRIHDRIHTKLKPYSCTHCDKSFSQRSTLTIHMRYHTGTRPYKCNICQKTFVTKTLLKMHLKVHGTTLVDV